MSFNSVTMGIFIMKNTYRVDLTNIFYFYFDRFSMVLATSESYLYK
jgi:hypothetical protein